MKAMRRAGLLFAGVGLLAMTLLLGGKAYAAEDFYWKNSYGRGGGAVPTSSCGSKQADAGLCYDQCKSGYNGVGPLCHNDRYDRGGGTATSKSCGGKQEDAGLCYPYCKSGYHGVGPVCWQGTVMFSASYGRGAGTAKTASCGGGMQMDGDACYTPCKNGYQGAGNMCYYGAAGASSYGRGAGTAPVPNCGGNQLDAGLCYAACRTGYTGSGPVCWGNPPQGYVDCGAGFAANSTACGIITASQAASVALLATSPAGIAAANAAKASKLGQASIKAAEGVAAATAKLMEKIGPRFVAWAKKPGEIGPGMKSVMAEAEAFFNDPAVAKKIEAGVTAWKIGKGEASAGYQIARGPEGAIDTLRLVATIASIVDNTGVTGLVASYAYPVYMP
jgi:hypothetical protein